jgi:hypothetical protein
MLHRVVRADTASNHSLTISSATKYIANYKASCANNVHAIGEPVCIADFDCNTDEFSNIRAHRTPLLFINRSASLRGLVRKK